MGQAKVVCRSAPVFVKRCWKAKKLVHHKENTKWWFVNLMAGDAVAIFGDYRPMYNGKPSSYAQALLDAAAGEIHHPRWAAEYKRAGLLMQFPCIPTKRKGRVRATPAALAVLDHWASRSKRFKEFVDVYVKRKARLEIADLGFDLKLGLVPAKLQAIITKAEEMERFLEANKPPVDPIPYRTAQRAPWPAPPTIPKLPSTTTPPSSKAKKSASVIPPKMDI